MKIRLGTTDFSDGVSIKTLDTVDVEAKPEVGNYIYRLGKHYYVKSILIIPKDEPGDLDMLVHVDLHTQWNV